MNKEGTENIARKMRALDVNHGKHSDVSGTGSCNITCTLLFFAIVFSITTTKAQVQDSTGLNEKVAVIGRPSADSITLRWAPLSLQVWLEGSKNGYTIERYVMVRNGALLSQPERSSLPLAAVKALPESQWEPLVAGNKYAAIAAQALYGDRFELDMQQQPDVFTIVNKVKENEQRYAFALFCADMSPLVAKALGLLYTDKNVKKGEKYLYRIIINNSADSLKGSIFIGPDDLYELSVPQNLHADFKEETVSLKWEKSRVGEYTAYILERSTDGKSFTSISDAPLVTVSPTLSEETRYEYAVDSLKDITQTYYYRVKGVTPFGEISEPSSVVSGKGSAPVIAVPYITSGGTSDNKTIKLQWEFPQESNKAIKGFSVERASNPRGSYSSLFSAVLPPEARSYQDKAPSQVNYYRVTAHAINGELYRSPIYYAQLVDSIPPHIPAGLKATIHESGAVDLSWDRNKDPDIYGYRIYRSNFTGEELTQITVEPVAKSSYTDTVNLNTLNESMYYSVMAIDINQNQSPLSAMLKVSLPDKVKPQPPVFLPVIASNNDVMLSWQPSSSKDVLKYNVYEQADNKQWLLIKSIPISADSIYQYAHTQGAPGKTKIYTVTAVDDAGLESDPATPVMSGKLNNQLRPGIKWKKAQINREKNEARLSWSYEQPAVQFFRVYRAQDEEQPVLYRTIPGDKLEFSDTLVPGKTYKYKVLVMFIDGSKSVLSEEINLKY